MSAIPEIHERLGASVRVNVDELADPHYELSFENWAAYGTFSENLAVDSEWQEFLEQQTQNLLRS